MTCNEKREGFYRGSIERSFMPEQGEQQQPQRLMKLQGRGESYICRTRAGS